MSEQMADFTDITDKLGNILARTYTDGTEYRVLYDENKKRIGLEKKAVGASEFTRV
jgi:hypothetical protein